MAQDIVEVLVNQAASYVVEVLVGTKGDRGLDAAPSEDAENALVVGTDGKLFVPASAGGGGATDLTYEASTRLLSSSSGQDVTLPLATDLAAGLVPASGGGTTKFLRSDFSWAEPVADAPIAYADSKLVADVVLTTANQWYDGPSIVLPAGTWKIDIASHYRRAATTGCWVTIRAFDGVSAIAGAEMYHNSFSGSELSMSAFCIETFAEETTVKLQMAVSTGSISAFMKAAATLNPFGNCATRITAIRL